MTVSLSFSCDSGVAYLRFPCFPLISWYTNLVEDRMQLTDNGRHLRGQVAGVHHVVLSRSQSRETDEPNGVVDVVL
jgi:hypothetical protein